MGIATVGIEVMGIQGTFWGEDGIIREGRRAPRMKKTDDAVGVVSETGKEWRCSCC